MKKVSFLNNLILSLVIATMLVACVMFSACDKLGLTGDKIEEFEVVLPSSTSTETTTAYDNTYFGLYKGIITGSKSSGTVKIEIYNGNSDVKAYLTVGDKTDELIYSTAFYYNQSTQTYVNLTYPEPLPSLTGNINMTIKFTGVFSSIDFSTSGPHRDFYGREYFGGYINESKSQIEGHENLVFKLYKETSDNIVSCFQGTSVDSKGNKGVFNIISDKYNPMWIHRGESEGMFAGPGTLIFENHTSESTDYMGGIAIKNEYKFKLSNSGIEGTWKATWAGGSNSGTFSCKIPLKKSN